MSIPRAPTELILEHALNSAHTATAHRNHAAACEQLEIAIDLLGQGAPSPIRVVDLMLELARNRFRAGNVASAWAACSAAADIARETADGATMADAAVIVRAITLSSVTGQVHALCIEALALLGNQDSVRSGRLRAQLAATGNIWVADTYYDLEPDTTKFLGENEDPEAAFLLLLAWHARYLGCEHVVDRLALADQAVTLGRRDGVEEYLAWGLLWRIEALLQMGRLVEVSAEFEVLISVAERMREQLWTCRIELLHAVLHHLEGRYGNALLHTERAREIGRQSGDETVSMDCLVMTASISFVTGEGLIEAEEAVRRHLDTLPYAAKGWLVEILAAAGKTEEARSLWKAVAPHVQEVPRRAPEWIIAATGNATMCVKFQDRTTAAILYTELLPFEDLLACADAQTPLAGPVAYYLGLLASLLGNPQSAHEYFLKALQISESINAVPFAELARHELAKTPPTDHLLTGREAEVAALLATGQSNRSIAQTLYISERTVEHHVSSILRKLGLPSRSALAAWQAGQTRY